MKLKQIALAALAVVSMGQALAGNTSSPDTSTLFVVVGDQNHTYMFDTGVTMSQVINGDVNYSAVLPNWSSFNFGATTPFDGLDEGSGVRWTVIAGTNVQSNLGNTVLAANALDAIDQGTFSGMKNLTVKNDAQRMLSWATSASDVLASGGSIAQKGADAFAGNIQFGIGNNNALYTQGFGNPGATSSLGLYYEAVSTISLNGAATVKAMDEIVTLNPTTGALTIAVAAVPEPETYALMLAGLAAVGFVAARRRRA